MNIVRPDSVCIVHRRLQKVAWCISLLVVGVTNVGCGTVTKYEYSQPVVGDAADSQFVNARINIASGRASITVHLTNVRIAHTWGYVFFTPIPISKPEVPISRYYGRSTERPRQLPSYFVVELLIVSGESTLFLNPNSACISVTESSRPICPTEWLGPTIPFPGDHRFDSLCQNAFTLGKTHIVDGEVKLLEEHDEGFTKLSTSSGVYLSPNSSACIALKYPTAPLDPRRAFSLELRNVKLNDEVVVIPPIRYVPNFYTGKVFFGA